jgi:hypothetical protein
MKYQSIWKVTYLGERATREDIDEARRVMDEFTRLKMPHFRYTQEHITINDQNIMEVWRCYEWKWWASLKVWWFETILKRRIFTG